MYVITLKEKLCSSYVSFSLSVTLGNYISWRSVQNNDHGLSEDCKKCTRPATYRVCIRPPKTLDIRLSMTELIQPLWLHERYLVLG